MKQKKKKKLENIQKVKYSKQMQSLKSVLAKSYSGNMLRIYRRTPMLLSVISTKFQ